MNTRAAIIGGALLLLVASAAGWRLHVSGAEADTMETADIETDAPALPIPPVPPRIASGPDYERCLDLLSTDPWGAGRLAETWQAAGGGEAAAHCLALATVAMGEPEDGAALLEQVAVASKASDVARATVFGQAAEAWTMADEPQHAYDAATRALALSPGDADLLIQRAVAAAALERHQASADDLDRALALDSTRTDALVLRSAALRHLGRLDRAQASLDLALGQDPDNPEALLERGILRQRHNDRTGARQDWERAIELAPDSTTADLAQQNLALLEAGPDRR
jgi:tetratricopeptide (TPR) repeat protein